MPKCAICEVSPLSQRTEEWFKENGIEFEEIHGNEYYSHVRYGDNQEAFIRYHLKDHPYLAPPITDGVLK